MNISISDSDIVPYVLDFLHSRKLHDSALTLENETGLLSKQDHTLDEDILFLRQLVLSGKWETLLNYLEPFGQLDDFNSTAMHYIILKQQYYDALHDALRNPKSETKSIVLKTRLNDIQPYCNSEQLEKLCRTELHDQSVTALRMQCFNDLLKLLSPVYDLEDYLNKAADAHKNNCLVNTFVNALFYKACNDECIERGHTNAHKTTSGINNLSLLDLHEFTNEPASPGLYFWINSLKSNMLFQNSFQQDEVRFQFNHLSKPKKSQTHHNVKSPISKNKTPDVISSKNFALSKETPVEVMPQRIPNENNNNNVVNNSNESYHKPDILAETSLEPGQVRSSQYSPPRDVRASLHQPNALASPKGDVDHQVTYNKPSASYPKLEQKPSPSTMASSKSPLVSPKTSEVANVRSPKSVEVKDSYSEFMMQRELLRKQKDNLLKDIENKERVREELHGSAGDTGTPVRSTGNVESKNKQEIRSSTKTLHSPTRKKQFVPIECFRDSLAIRSVAFHPSGMVYAVGSNTKTLRICAVHKRIINGQHVSVNLDNHSPSPTDILNEIPRIHKGSIYCVCWNDEGTLLLSGSNDKMVKIHSYDVLSREFIAEPKEMCFHRGIIRDATFMSGHGNVFASAGADKIVYITDCNQEKNIMQLSGHADNIVSLYSWNQNLVASSSQDSTVRVWDLRTAKCANVIGVNTDQSKFPLSICVNHDGSLLGIGQESGIVSLYNLFAGKFAVNFKPHEDEIRSIRFNTYEQSNQLLTGSYDGRIVLQDVDSYMRDPTNEYFTTVADEKDKVIQCRWHPNGMDFASTSAGKYCSYYHQLPM